MVKPALGALAVLALVTALGWLAGADGLWVGPAPLLATCGAAAVVAQWLAWAPAAWARSERWYDLTGSVTYVSVTALALGSAAAAGAIDPRKLLVASLVCTWALRLGTFLFRRVHADGGDARFDAIKTDPGRFLVAWTLQGAWVCFTALAAWVAISRATPGPPLGPLDALGLATWAVGFGLEVVADAQKRRFKADPANRGRFIDTGLWAWSRHPNYFGEIVLWCGVLLLSAGNLSGWAWLGVLSPLFVVVLLTRVSGVPLLEARADARWGDDPRYLVYKEQTPVLIPRPPRR